MHWRKVCQIEQAWGTLNSFETTTKKFWNDSIQGVVSSFWLRQKCICVFVFQHFLPTKDNQ